MKKISFFTQLIIINVTLIIVLICACNNISVWEYCPLGAEYLFVFSLSYFIESYTSILWITIVIISINIILNISAIISYKKDWCNYIIAIVLAIDMIISLILGYFVTLVIDFLALIIIIGFADKGKKKIRKDSVS